jgi:replication factor C small subunit
MAITELWTEKYRPTTIDSYVFKDKRQKQQIESWIAQKSFANIMLSGNAGVGKSSLAKILIGQCEVHPLDVLEINASRNNSVDDVRNKITNFVQMMPFGEFKVVFLDEVDYTSLNGQAILRGVMEEYQATARFILTCNYPNRVMPAIHSRCQSFHIDKVDINEYTARVATILLSENIDFDLDTLDTFVKASYPDLRKCINTVQLNSVGNKLQVPDSSDVSSDDYKLKMVELFKAGKISEARKLICSQIRPEEVDEVYRWLYTNIELLGDTDEKQEDAILIIKQGLVDHAVVIDPEINLSAVLIRLARNAEK